MDEPTQSVPVEAGDFLVLRVNRAWLQAIAWKVKSCLAIAVLLGGGTITTSVASLWATLSGQERDQAALVAEMSAEETEKHCTAHGFAKLP